MVSLTARGPGLLLDRDGVINEECHYLHRPEDAILVPGAAQAIAMVNRLALPVAVVSNQAGIGRGHYGEPEYQAVTRAIAAMLAEHSAHIDAWYFCPHLPDAGCPCRKPRPGMLLAAAGNLGLELGRSVMVGDNQSNLEAGRAVTARTVLVRTGYGQAVEAALAAQGRELADHIADSLATAIPFILAALAPQGGQDDRPRQARDQARR